ncbi:MAG: gliding motility-associated C-terminal domain-containing protein [Bacteroidota bacterium]
MKKILIIVFVFSLRSGYAQVNLISNYSFEIHDTCPNAYSQLNYAIDWYKINNLNSCELYDSCSDNLNISVPENIMGFQNAKTGCAYAGIYTYIDGYVWREFIINNLKEPLISNKEYCFSFHINLANKNKYSNNSIGAYFSDTLIHVDNAHADGYNLGITPDLENTSILLNDSVNWIKLEWEYIAKGGEQYVMIGNFRNDSTSDISVINPSAFAGAYYYIDDVSLVYCGEDTIPPEPIENSMNVVSAFTPNGDGVNDLYYVKGTNINSVHLRIINRWGQLLYEATGENPGWDGKYNGNDVSSGVYYYIVEVIFKDGELRNKAGAIHLFR